MEDSWPTCTGHLQTKELSLGVGDIYYVCGLKLSKLVKTKTPPEFRIYG